MTVATDIRTDVQCFHCGTPAGGSGIEHDGKVFCCAGCRAVYQILSESQLCRYYEFDQSPGLTPALRSATRFEFLDDSLLSQQLIDFSDDSATVITFSIPQIHCSSCIWLLENLHKLDRGIAFSRVDFLKKSLLIRFSRDQTSLRKIVTLLASLGYEPELSLGSIKKKPAQSANRSLYIKVGVAAFSFGNIMLFSLPEYFAGSRADFSSRNLFGIINLVLALPAVLYSSSLFYLSALHGIRKRVINIDVPIAMGIAVVFVRSAVEVLAGIGPGYFDSLAGLIFFLLIGRLFQSKTYEGLDFERQCDSYFPLAAAVKKNGRETTVQIGSLRPGDRIVVRNNEIIPADAVVMKGTARVDYSFVTGEHHSVLKEVGDLVYAGGKQAGSTVELEAVKEVSESKLVQLWNDFGASERAKSRLLTLSTTIGKYFTIGILLIAVVTAFAWWFINPSRLLDAVTAILIVACPCALALAAPFAFGTAMRVLGKRGLYLKNTNVVESLAKVDTIVFDKTGTLTQTAQSSIRFTGEPLNDHDRLSIASIARSSTHPLSRTIYEHLTVSEVLNLAAYEEIEGGGIRGRIDGRLVQLGSAEFVDAPEGRENSDVRRTKVYAAIDGRVLGRFEFGNTYRGGLEEVLTDLGRKRSLMMLSGDGNSEEQRLRELYPGFEEMRFDQSPADKLACIRQMQDAGRNVLMIGDGLNDAGALWQSDVAIAVTEGINTFSPACDAILDASMFNRLARFIEFASSSLHVVYWSFALSILYNAVGLWFAVQGALSPVLAAILMPLSSISVVLFSTTVTRSLAKQKGIL